MRYLCYTLFLLLTDLYIKCDASGLVNPDQLRYNLDMLKITTQFELNMLKVEQHQELNKTMAGMDTEIDSMVKLLSTIDPKTPDGKLRLQNLDTARLALTSKIESEQLAINDKIAKMQQSTSLQLALDVAQLHANLLVLVQKSKSPDTTSKLVQVSLPILDTIKHNVLQAIQQIGIELQKLP
ncbi:uncharacterized protein LOC128952310 [Oppia nitens]|uniref:uncharacterized protein LOC128952310 n=1 Tax=Oppia nitens TaxID=1686743 RepID=UPI0023DA61B5|nr:uncharacterized protein LOC128952310 [Oppia nitens]